MRTAPAFLSSTVTVGGVCTLNNVLSARNAVTISAGRGRENSGAWLKLIGTGDSVYNTSALSFGCANVETHVIELSWKGFSHFMRANASAAWYQTMEIESTGRWRFTTGLSVIGTCLATVYSTSDGRIKDDVQNIPEQDALNLLRTVSAKTYTRKDMPGKRRAGFIARDFLNLPLSLGENLVEKVIGKITPDLRIQN